MRKVALVLSLCGGGATLIAALLLAMQAIPNHMNMLAIGGEVLLGLACTAVALATDGGVDDIADAVGGVFQ